MKSDCYGEPKDVDVAVMNLITLANEERKAAERIIESLNKTASSYVLSLVRSIMSENYIIINHFMGDEKNW